MNTVTTEGAVRYVAKDKPHLWKRGGRWGCAMQYGRKSKGRKLNWARAAAHARRLNSAEGLA